MLSTLRKARYLVAREQRGRWVLLVLLALLSSSFEILGALLVYLLLALVADPGGEIELPLVGDVRGWFDVEQQTLLLWLAAVMAIVFILRAVVRVGAVYAQNRVGYKTGARLSAKLIGGYLRMPYTFHLRHNSSRLIRNGHQAVTELVRSAFLPVIHIISESILVVTMLALLVALAPLATALAMLVIGGAAVLLMRVIQPRLKRLGVTAHRLEGETLRYLQQSFEGIRDIKVLDLDRAFARIYDRARRKLARTTYLRATASELPRTVLETALIGFILLFFVLAIATGVGAEGALSTLGLFAYAGLRLQPSLHRIIAGLHNLRFAAAPLEDVHADLLDVEAAAADGRDEDAQPIPFERSLDLESVAVRYEGGDRDALDGIDLSVRPGEVLGVCGPTGGGKTTLVDIMTGLLTPTTGRVTVDGRDLREHARSWQRHLGVVPQMVFLIDDTLRRNIALGIPDAEIDEEAVQEALSLAQLQEFVASLPQGLDTVVGERGVRVSGGQRQRIAIARALYRRPSVLVFDEGTSALDTGTESALMDSLHHLRGTHTIIMVAHRLSTVRDCDRIVYIDEGRIAGLGDYEELLASHAAFRRLAAT